MSTVNCQLPTATRTASTRTAPTTGAWASGDRIIVTLQYFSDDAGTYPDLDAQGTPLPGTGALIDTDALGLPTSQTLTYTPETSDPDNNTIPAHWTAQPARLPLPPGARSLRASYRMVSAPDPLTATCEQMAGYLPSGDYPLSTLHSQPSTVLGPDRGSGITMRIEDFEKELTGDWTALYFGNLTLPDADMQAQIAAPGWKITYAQMTRVYAALVPIEDPTQPVVLPAPVWKRQSTALILQDLRPGQTVDVEKTSVLGKPETVPLALPAHYASPADVRLHFMARREVIVNSRGLLDKPHNSSPDQYFFALTDPAVALHQPLLRPRYERVEYWPGEQFVIPASALYLGSETGDMQPVDGTDYDACKRYLTADNPRWVVSGGSKDRDEAIAVATNVSAALWRVARADADARIDVLLTEAGWLPQDRNTTGRGAFEGCTALRSLSAPQATTIEYGTFHQCSNLVYIDLPLATDDLGENAFGGCTALQTVSLPKMKGGIGDYAFEGCYTLTSLSLPQMTGSIGGQAFNGCMALTTVSLPQMAGDIGVKAFLSCPNLTTVSLPAMKGSIGSDAFYDCESLQSIDLPQMAGGIGMNAFLNCKALQSISLPQMAGDIGKQAFYGCESLTTLSLPQMKGGIGNSAFFECKALTTLDLPQMEGDIGDKAFGGCNALQSISLPAMTGRIGERAFSGCPLLKRLELTSPGIISMEYYAFEGLDIAASTGFVLVLGKGQQCFRDGENGQFIDTAGDYVIIYLTPVSSPTSTTPMHNDNNPTVRVEVISQP
ncbi:leucine-rich repeat domain-containing protein [uncultured Bacteroides sp.]|uniref:leucine-rich repeat domain-containing protein n=1 Tax=uncultured Bacteroides sp. TaxID=162156 RepID=UPI0025E16FE9|nr:leucine-rich repeat domain-containing protein [uncultured Bacteroides sp.]